MNGEHGDDDSRLAGQQGEEALSGHARAFGLRARSGSRFVFSVIGDFDLWVEKRLRCHRIHHTIGYWTREGVGPRGRATRSPTAGQARKGGGRWMQYLSLGVRFGPCLGLDLFVLLGIRPMLNS